MNHSFIPYVCIATTVACTVYGQLIVKWRVNMLGSISSSLFSYYKILFVDPLFLSGLFAVIPAGLCWIYAIKHVNLSIAYPFIGLTFALVLLGSAIVLREPITIGTIIGTLLIIVGISIIAIK